MKVFFLLAVLLAVVSASSLSLAIFTSVSCNVEAISMETLYPYGLCVPYDATKSTRFNGPSRGGPDDGLYYTLDLYQTTDCRGSATPNIYFPATCHIWNSRDNSYGLSEIRQDFRRPLTSNDLVTYNYKDSCTGSVVLTAQVKYGVGCSQAQPQCSGSTNTGYSRSLCGNDPNVYYPSLALPGSSGSDTSGIVSTGGGVDTSGATTTTGIGSTGSANTTTSAGGIGSTGSAITTACGGTWLVQPSLSASDLDFRPLSLDTLKGIRLDIACLAGIKSTCIPKGIVIKIPVQIRASLVGVLSCTGCSTGQKAVSVRTPWVTVRVPIVLPAVCWALSLVNPVLGVSCSAVNAAFTRANILVHLSKINIEDISLSWNIMRDTYVKSANQICEGRLNDRKRQGATMAGEEPVEEPTKDLPFVYNATDPNYINGDCTIAVSSCSLGPINAAADWRCCSLISNNTSEITLDTSTTDFNTTRFSAELSQHISSTDTSQITLVAFTDTTVSLIVTQSLADQLINQPSFLHQLNVNNVTLSQNTKQPICGDGLLDVIEECDQIGDWCKDCIIITKIPSASSSTSLTTDGTTPSSEIGGSSSSASTFDALWHVVLALIGTAIHMHL